MKAVQCTFQRYEKKYVVRKEQYEQLVKLMEPYMELDEYGRHTICNIYYDTQSYELIRTSLEKPAYKEKLRLRSYGIPTDESQVFLELKKKVQGIVYKRRIAMPYREVEPFLLGKEPEVKTQIHKEISYFMKQYDPSAKVVIAYDRMAYVQKDNPDIRITFDFAIRARQDHLDLRFGDVGAMLLKEEEVLMEVKVPNSLPLWLCNVFACVGVFPTSYSKYGTCYTEQLYDEFLCQLQQQRKKRSAISGFERVQGMPVYNR